MKGISLPLETVILLILMAIVLAAILAFFLGVFNPSKGKFEVLQARDSLCLRYVSVDPECDEEYTSPRNKEQGENIIREMQAKVYNKPAGEPICTELKNCCLSWCRDNSADTGQGTSV